MAELGETRDPEALVPGDVGLLTSYMFRLLQWAEHLTDAGTGLTQLMSPEHWAGAAAEAFRGDYRGDPTRWTVAGECFTAVGEALDRYGWTLFYARPKAAEIVALWQSGEDQTAIDRAHHEEARLRARVESARTGTRVAVPRFVDTGEPARQVARELLAELRSEVTAAAADAATTIRAASLRVPPTPAPTGRRGRCPRAPKNPAVATDREPPAGERA